MMEILCRVTRFLAVAVAVTASQFAQADLKEIQASGELRHLGIRYANFVTGAGDGFDVELAKGFAKHIGVKHTLVYTDFYNVIRDLLGREVRRTGDRVDLTGRFPVKGDMIATGFTRLPWREQVLLFSAPTFPSQVLLIARAESAQKPIKSSDNIDADIAETKAMIGQRSLLVMEKTCLDPASYGLKGKGFDLKPYTKNTNINEMVPAMLDGVAELTLLDVPDVILDLQKWAGKIKILGPISGEQQMAAAFRPDSPQLRDAFDAYLRRIRADGTYDRLVRKYYPGIDQYFPEFFARMR